MSPAGYWPQLKAAIEAGADAVYFGLKHFSARAKVGFDVAEIPDVMRALHERGVRGYLTFNTLVFEHEVGEAARTIASVVKAGVDALIVQDIGIVKLAREIAPSIELHASTQMSITNEAGVRLAQSFGIERVTLARELSLTEIRSIVENTECDLEIFVHGALCVAYSGQCFSSEAWGGRSANRGQCAQACRLPYELLVDSKVRPLGDSRYLLSPGDLYALEQVPEIVDIGVAALKIEGRYKDAEYVAMTTNAYRRAVDAAWSGIRSEVSPADRLQLEQVYSRGLGPYFLSGTNHQQVVNGRAPRHRGVLMGQVESVTPDAVVIRPSSAQAISPLKPGDGIVFDAADWRSPEEREEGGRIYQALEKRGRIELRFANRAIQFDRIRPGDCVWRSDDPKLAEATKPFTGATAPVARQPISVRVRARAGTPVITDWTLVNHPEVQVQIRSSDPAATAETRKLDVVYLRSQLGRLGNTAYELAELELDVEGDPYVPASTLNQIRRHAVEALRAKQIAPPDVSVREPGSLLHPRRVAATRTVLAPEMHLLVRTPGQLEAAIEARPSSITLDYLDLYGLRPSVDRVRAKGITVRAASPRVLKPGEEKILNFLLSLRCAILVRGAGMLEALASREHGELIGDFSLNVANSFAAEEMMSRGLARLTPTHDLNAAQVSNLARAVGGELIEAVVYQHMPIFHTEHCVFCRFLSKGTSYRDCGRPCEKHTVALQDANGRAHPVLADIGCRNTVFGSEAQEASAYLNDWLAAGIRHVRLEFVDETGEELAPIVDVFKAALAGDISGPELHEDLARFAPEGVTEGSLFVPKHFFELPVLQ